MPRGVRVQQWYRWVLAGWHGRDTLLRMQQRTNSRKTPDAASISSLSAADGGRRRAWRWVAVGVVVAMLGGIATMGVLYVQTLNRDTDEKLDAVDLEYKRIAERADRAIQDRRAGRVLEDAQAFAEAHPDYALGHRLLGQVRYSAGRHDPPRRRSLWPAAYEAWQQSLALEPEDESLHLLAGDLALQLNEPDVARQHFETLLELDPTSLQYQVRLCWAKINQGEFDRAQAGLEAVLRRDSEHHEAAYYRGVLAQRRAMSLEAPVEREQLLLEARQWVSTAIRHLRPQEIQKRDLMVRYLRQQSFILRMLAEARGGDAATARQALAVLRDRLFSSEIAEITVLREIAECYRIMKQPASAARMYESHAEQHPRNWQYRAHAAHWWLQAGEPDRAAAHFEVLVTLDPQLRHNPARQRAIAELREQLTAQRNGRATGADPETGLDETGGLY